jgi:hypothetical protein
MRLFRRTFSSAFTSPSSPLSSPPPTPLPSSSLLSLTPNFNAFHSNLSRLVSSGNADITFLRGQPDASEVFRAIFPNLVTVCPPPPPPEHDSIYFCCFERKGFAALRFLWRVTLTLSCSPAASHCTMNRPLRTGTETRSSRIMLPCD